MAFTFWKLFIFVFLKTSFAQPESNQCQKLPENIDIDSLLTLIKTSPEIQTVEDVICKLPLTIIENYTLVGKSASAQSSSLKHPRVILFKKGLKSKISFLMSFNGNSDDTNYKHIEVLKINRNSLQTNPLEFIDVNFDNTETGKRVAISSPNPPECMQCHGIYHDKPRPIWDAECFFPTSYNRMKLTSSDSIPRVTNDLTQFLGIAMEHNRYKELKPLADHPSDVLKKIVDNNNHIYRDLADINLNRVSQLIRKTPQFNIFKYSILASLLGCENIESFLTPQWLEKMSADHINLNFKGTGSLIKDYLGDTEKKVDPVTWSCTRTNVNSIANFRFLLEGRGISMEEWAMDTPSNGFISFYRFIGHGLGTEALASRISKKESNLNLLMAKHLSKKELKSFHGPLAEEGLISAGPQKLSQICSQLKKESSKVLLKYPPVAKNASQKEERRIPSSHKNGPRNNSK